MTAAHAVRKVSLQTCSRNMYLNCTCVILLEVDYGLSAARYLDLVLRAEPRHHCTSLVSNRTCTLGVGDLDRTFYRIGAPAGTRMLACCSVGSAAAGATYDIMAAQYGVSGPAASVCSFGARSQVRGRRGSLGRAVVVPGTVVVFEGSARRWK